MINRIVSALAGLGWGFAGWRAVSLLWPIEPWTAVSIAIAIIAVCTFCLVEVLTGFGPYDERA